MVEWNLTTEWHDDKGLLDLMRREQKANLVNAALEKVCGANKARRAIEAGMPTLEALDTFGMM